MSAEPYTREEIDAMRSSVETYSAKSRPSHPRWLATLDARDAEIARLTKRVEEAEDALLKVLIHTAHLPDAPRDLLVGLLKSCARCASNGLDAIRPAPSTPANPATGEGG